MTEQQIEDLLLELRDHGIVEVPALNVWLRIRHISEVAPREFEDDGIVVRARRSRLGLSHPPGSESTRPEWVVDTAPSLACDTVPPGIDWTVFGVDYETVWDEDQKVSLFVEVDSDGPISVFDDREEGIQFIHDYLRKEEP